MESYKAVEELKALIIENNLPRTEMALFGIKCPYCGKSDRIRTLETPDDLAQAVDSTQLAKYADLWQQLNPTAARLGFCKFCLNPLRLQVKEGHAKGLENL